MLVRIVLCLRHAHTRVAPSVRPRFWRAASPGARPVAVLGLASLVLAYIARTAVSQHGIVGALAPVPGLTGEEGGDMTGALAECVGVCSAKDAAPLDGCICGADALRSTADPELITFELFTMKALVYYVTRALVLFVACAVCILRMEGLGLGHVGALMRRGRVRAKAE